MFLDQLRKIGLVALVLVVAACAKVDIQAPADNSVSDLKPTDFEVTFSQGTPNKINMYLNSVKVTQHFTITGSGATASGTDLDPYIFSGRNIFRVATETQNKQITFFYDTDGPQVHVLTADRTAGTIEGYLEDPSGAVSLTLDGVAVALDESLGFSTTFNGSLDINEFIAEDTYGHVSTTQYAKNTFSGSSESDRTVMSARLNNGGFTFLGDVLAEEIEDMEFANISIGFPLLFDLRIQDISVGRPDFDINVFRDGDDDDILQVYANIPDVEFATTFAFFIFPHVNVADTKIDRLVLDTNLLLSIIDSDLDFSIKGNTRAVVHGLDLNIAVIELLPLVGGVIDAVISGVTNAFVNLFIGLFTPLITDIAIPLLSDFVEELPISLTFAIDGNELQASVLPTYLEAFSNGVTVDLDGSVIAPNPDPEVIPTLGYVYVDGETPTISVQTPSGDDFDMGVGISSNFINQALLAAHESGLTTLQIRPDNTPGASPEGVSVIQSEEDDIQQADLIGMSLIPASAPYLLFDGDDQLALGKLVWDDVILEFDLKRIGWEDYQNIFHAKFNLEVPFELDAQDGFLVIGIEQIPEIFITESNNTGAIQLTPDFINGILKYFLPVIMPAVADRLKSVPLPRVAGYSIHPDDFWVTGASSNTLALGGTMVKIEDTEAAPEPTTILTSGAVGSSVSSSAVEVENGEVTIQVDGINPSAGILESRYRVDNGPWSVWKPRSEIHLPLLLGGRHVVEVCSRTLLMKVETGCPTVEFDTTVVE